MEKRGAEETAARTDHDRSTLSPFLLTRYHKIVTVSGGSGGAVNSLDFYPASLKSLGSFHIRCVLFFTMEGGESEYAKFTVPTLKASLRPVVKMCLATSNSLLLL